MPGIPAGGAGPAFTRAYKDQHWRKAPRLTECVRKGLIHACTSSLGKRQFLADDWSSRRSRVRRFARRAVVVCGSSCVLGFRPTFWKLDGLARFVVRCLACRLVEIIGDTLRVLGLRPTRRQAVEEAHGYATRPQVFIAEIALSAAACTEKLKADTSAVVHYMRVHRRSRNRSIATSPKSTCSLPQGTLRPMSISSSSVPVCESTRFHPTPSTQRAHISACKRIPIL